MAFDLASVGSQCDRARSLYGRSVALIACASERTTQHDRSCFRSLDTLFYDHGQSLSPSFSIRFYRTAGFRPIPFHMYLRSFRCI